MNKIPLGTALGYYKYPVNNSAAVNLHCHEGFEDIKPEEIEITIRPTNTYSSDNGITHQINNQLLSRVNIGDYEWLTGGIKIHSLADKHIGQFIQIRIEPTGLVISGIDIEIKPNHWCPEGAKFEVPREGPLSNGITIGLEFCRHQVAFSYPIEQSDQIESIRQINDNHENSLNQNGGNASWF